MLQEKGLKSSDENNRTRKYEQIYNVKKYTYHYT